MKNIVIGVLWILTTVISGLGLVDWFNLRESIVWLAMYRLSLCYGVVALTSRLFYGRKEFNRLDFSMLIAAWILGYVFKYVDIGVSPVQLTEKSHEFDVWFWFFIWAVVMTYGTVHAVGNMCKSIKVLCK